LINSAKGLALAEPARKPDSRQKLKISAMKIQGFTASNSLMGAL
jgi:hypothetical protein